MKCHSILFPFVAACAAALMSCSTHQAMEVDGGKGHLSGKLQPHHDHARHPEEEDVMPCLHDGCGVELGQVRGGGVCLRPAKGAEGPQAR